MRRTLLLAGAVLAAGIVAPVSAGAGTAAMPEVQIVERTSAPTMGDLADVVVGCPDGTKLHSAGGRVNGVLGQAVLHNVQPMPDLSRVVVHARLRVAGPAWSVTGYAICAPGNPVLQANASIMNIVHKEDTEVCAAGTVTGIGSEFGTATSQVALMRLIPDLALNSATAAASGPDLPGVWTVQASAICADGINGAVLKTATSAFDGLSPKKVTADCGDMKVLGVGGGVINNAVNEHGVLTELKPDPDGKRVHAMGTSGASPWAMAAYAICVPA